MLTSFTVKNYRGFRDLTVEGLSRINLVAGENNSGKTSFLEAVALLIDPSSEMIVAIHRNRRISDPRDNTIELVRWMSPGGNPAKIVEMRGASDDAPERRVSLEILTKEGMEKNDENLFAQFMSRYSAAVWKEAIVARVTDGEKSPTSSLIVPHAHGLIATTSQAMRPWRLISSGGDEPNLIEDFSRIKVDQTLDGYLPALKHIEPRLRDLDLANFAGVLQIYGNVGLGRLLPLPLMGEGIARVLTLVTEIGSCPGGILFVDEVENGLHHSVLENVWQAIGDAARVANCQVFATTHSYECIRAAQAAFANNGEEDLTFIRLERDGDAIRPIVVNERGLATAMEFDWEMR